MENDHQTDQNTKHVYHHNVPKPKRFQFRKKDGTIVFQTGLLGMFWIFAFGLPFAILIVQSPLIWIIGIGGIIYAVARHNSKR